ncbi:MAG TPA: CPBP family intramembrane glutamic endopeptidase [Burkholderiales bacterium]|nr:CPBP family intramembrane glutamic endopeptidase [Burkholderiales bacterium]
MPDPVQQCPACGRNLRPGTQFCPGCGKALGAAAAPEQRDAAASSTRFARQWAELKRVGWVFGLLLASSFVFGIAWRSNHSPWSSVIQSAVDAAIILGALGLGYRKLSFLFKVHPMPPQSALAIVAAGAVFVVGASGYFWLLARLGVPILSSTGSFTGPGWPAWTMFLLISLTPAVFEELAFRGVIQSSLERVLNARDAWLIQAALFSVLHLSPLMFPSHFLMGLCLGYMRRLSRSIYPGMLLHAGWNAIVMFRELHAG